MKNTVNLIYGNAVESMVSRLITETGMLDTLRPHDTVVIKPNLVVSREHWRGIDTDPRIVEALVKALKERGLSRITIGDGSGMGYSAKKAFQICGYTDLARQYGLTLVDLEKDHFVRKPVTIDGPFEHLDIAQTVLDCDFLINVPVLKAHSGTLITCSLKNLKGVMTRAKKSAFHGVDLSKAISQLAGVLSPDLIVVDGLQGDLSSETGYHPVTMDRILMGVNPVEIDSVVADMLGYTPRTIRHIAYSADAGLGICDLENIHIRSLNSPEVDLNLEPPPHYSERFPCHISAEGACCSCMGNLIFALERLKEKGLLSRNQHFMVGQKSRMTSIKKNGLTITVGHCATEKIDADIPIGKCPPTAHRIYNRVRTAIRKTVTSPKTLDGPF